MYLFHGMIGLAGAKLWIFLFLADCAEILADKPANESNSGAYLNYNFLTVIIRINENAGSKLS